ncbi:MAG: sulfatase [Gammaproteobacteria bacterium]|nr:sulfatase [Gammaproteobacteria bacterium]
MKKICLGFVLLTTLLLAACVTPPPEQQPNVVLLLVDDLGWRDVGFMGSDFYETPNIDDLAARSTVFNQAYSAHPVCSPTRAALMTGRDPARIGITDWIPGYEPENPSLADPSILDQLPLEEVTLAELFQQAGYSTLMTGKWHLGQEEAYWPEHQGFGTNIGGHDRGSPPGGYFSPYKNPRLEDGPKGEFLTGRLGHETSDFIRRHADEPFFVYHAFYSVHTPIQAVPNHIDYFTRKSNLLGPSPPNVKDPVHEFLARTRQDNPDYASMVAAVDDVVGEIIQTLEDLGLEDDTIIVFTSDNGGLSANTAKHRTRPTSTLPLRAGKGWIYEGGIRVPQIINVPGLTRPGSNHNGVVTTVDLFPTLLALANIDLPGDRVIDGIDLSSALAGNELPVREPLVWHFPHYHGAGWRPGTAIRLGDWKLVRHYESGDIELFNLATDPGELEDIATANPAKVAELEHELELWFENTGAAVPEMLPVATDANMAQRP